MHEQRLHRSDVGQLTYQPHGARPGGFAMLHEVRTLIAMEPATSGSKPLDSQAHERLRLRVLFVVAALKLFNFMGGAWDIQWHVAIGRDSLFIPPHLLVMVAFAAGLVITAAMIAYETLLVSRGHALRDTVRIGPLTAGGPMFGIASAYLFALLSTLLDELWHEIFGIDVTLWSPPHLLIMVSTVIVDFSLMIGITSSARRLGHGFTLRSPLTWGLLLTGAYAFESVNFQMGEAFIIGFRHGGAGLYGLLFPILVGAFLPLSMMTLTRLAGRNWVVLPTAGLTLAMQYVATGVAAAGFAILKPVSVIEEYVRDNPDSTISMAREFARRLGFNGLIGFHQAWTMMLMVAPLALVSLVPLVPWERRNPLVAAPVFSVGMVLLSFLWFQQMPSLAGYPISGLDLAIGSAISAAGGLVTGSVGMRLARLARA
jgi:hypothetical protein